MNKVRITSLFLVALMLFGNCVRGQIVTFLYRYAGE